MKDDAASQIGNETRWLSADQQRFWRLWLRVTARVSDSITQDLRRDSQLTEGDYEVLARLSEAEDRRLRMSELAGLAVHSASRLSMRVDRLAKAGLVKREKCPDDKRGFFAVLTAAGFAKLAAAAPDHVASVRANLVDRLTDDELKTLTVILTKLHSD